MNEQPSNGGGRISSQVMMWAASLAVGAVGSYLALQRDDSDRTREALALHSRQLAVAEARIDDLRAAAARCGRERE